MDDRYDVEVLVCHGCAARERKAYARHSAQEDGSPPPFGEFLIVHAEEED